MKFIFAGVLDVAYYEYGPNDGIPTILVHGFPYDAHAFDEVAKLLATSGHRCIVPFVRGYGPTRFRDAETMRSGQQAAVAADLLALMDSLHMEKAILGGYDWGGRAAAIVSALWPERVLGLVTGNGYSIQDLARVAEPMSLEQEKRNWYQFYLCFGRGRTALERDPAGFCEFLWRDWSPNWAFDRATLERTVASFDNPDFLDVVAHSYKHRLGVAAGDPSLEPIEARLARHPDITVPTIVILGGADGVDPPTDLDLDAVRFKDFYQRRIVPGAGHNIPQEAPTEFAQAIQDIALLI